MSTNLDGHKVRLLTPEKFNALGKYQKLEIVYQTQLTLLSEIGVLKAQIEQHFKVTEGMFNTLVAYYQGIKEQVDILANDKFLQDTMKERQENKE